MEGSLNTEVALALRVPKYVLASVYSLGYALVVVPPLQKEAETMHQQEQKYIIVEVIGRGKKISTSHRKL